MSQMRKVSNGTRQLRGEFRLKRAPILVAHWPHLREREKILLDDDA
jgi:hypothetical protein